MAEPTSAADNQILKPHSNAIVPHKIANHDTEAVQLNVWNGTEWVNIYDDNDMRNMNIDLHKVSKVVEKHAVEIPAVESAANSAVEQAESAVSASKVNSEAIAAQSEAVSEAKSAISSATAAIQQTAATAASDAAKIRADVVQMQSEIDANKTANSASVEALKSDVSAAKQDLADVHDRLDQAQSAIEQNQKLINDSVAKITSDVSATKQDLATVHDSLTKVQAAAEQNQKAIDDSIVKINANVDVTNQDLAGVRKDLTKAQSDIAANQKSINDNVAQINADITQDRKDIASAQQANADTAKQLDTYSKQATEQSKTIKTIQDKQDGFTATLADVQGNVSQVSDKVDGLSASLKDAQGNVASVKAQADQLSATLTDHAKSIATLTASAKELSSTLEDADGRLSKVEQTAKTNSSTLADVQGDLSQVKQDATALTSTLKDAQGNISTLQQKADRVSAQLASAQGDIATLQTGVDSVKATLTSHDKSIHTLQADSKSLKDSMADAQGDISTLSKTATDVTSELEDHTGRLSKVEQSAAKQATTLSDLQGNLSQVKQQADGLVTTLKNAQGSITQIQQKADGTLAQLKSAQGDIASLQTDVTGIKAALISHEGDIHTLQADSKTLKDDMQDAQGNISTLKKTSTDVTAELQDHTGRISKTEQTAATLTNEFADQQGHLNRVEQTAQGTQQTVANQQGQINNIKTDVSGVHETITGQGNQIANINVTLNGLNSKYEGVSGDLGKLKDQTNWKIVTGVLDANQYTKTARIFYQDIQAKNTPNIGWFYLIVDAPSTSRITQTLIRDNATDMWTRVYNGSWKAWTKGATNLDITALSNRITTNSTQITQNQQAIALKADQTTVNNLSSEVSQNKAQLKIQADQISSKVSSTDFTALNSRTMQNRGTVSSPDFNSLTQAGYYTVTNPINGKNYPISNWGTLEVSGQTVDGNGRLNQKYVGDNNGGTYTRQYNADTKTWTAWTKGANQNDINTLNGKITKNSTAIDQTNKQISLKADQTEVNQVKDTASKNSSRLDVMANEIKQKVDGTTVTNILDSKGYATMSYAQTLVKQTKDQWNVTATDLDTKIKDKDGINLLTGTADFTGNWFRRDDTSWTDDNWRDTNGNRVRKRSGSAWNGLGQTVHLEPGNYTFSMDMYLNLGTTDTLNFYAGDTQYNGTPNIVQLIDGKRYDHNSPQGSWFRAVCHFKVTKAGNVAIRPELNQYSGTVHVGSYKLEKGLIATPWTPAPSDNASVTQISNLQISIDGIQSTVANKADKSQITQLSNVIQSKVNSSDYNSKMSQLSNDINARVTKGDMLSQINVEAGRTLIQSNKIYFDADSFVMSANSKAFIPSAFITNLSADKITTGTLDASKLHVKNFSADNISGGTLKGIDIQTSDSKSNFEITGPWIQWKSVDENKTAEEPYYLVNIGSGSTDLIAANSNAQNAINASNGKMFSIVSNHGLVLSSGMASGEDYSDPTKIIAPDYYPKLTLVGWDVGNQEATGAYIDAGKTTLELHGQFYESETDRDTEIKTRGFGLDTWNRVQFNFKHFNDGGHSGDYYNGAEFAIQKDNKLTADFGGGKNGNEINFTALGGTNIHGNFHVTGSKNSIVKTTQGYLAINAYETAEYYFGDIGEANTGASGKVIIGIDRIFNETVNTDIQYQVFLTSYSNALLWVSERHNNRFVVESDTPNAEFGWELKAKRKGYEGNRLRVVHGDFDNPELLKGSTN